MKKAIDELKNEIEITTKQDREMAEEYAGTPVSMFRVDHFEVLIGAHHLVIIPHQFKKVDDDKLEPVWTFAPLRNDRTKLLRRLKHDTRFPTHPLHDDVLTEINRELTEWAK